MVRSPAWLRRSAMGLVLLGAAHLLATIPVYRMEWRALPLESALANLWAHVASGLWIAGSGMILGMLAESAKREEMWAAPLARGVVNVLCVGGLLAPALMWNNPFAWIFAVLSVLAWWSSRLPAAT